MEEQDLKLLIARLETYAEKHPSLYRLRVALLAAIGYTYLLLVVFLLLALVYVTLVYVRISYLTIKIIWIPLALLGLVLRSLWVTIPEPDGNELRNEQAKRLFDLITEVRKALGGPRVHRVLLSDEFNAGIVQIPRFGMFGWFRNYLVIGLPLLQALSPEEFRAVLAHEFGHLSGKHGRFSGWIYRLRRTWTQIFVTVDQERHYASFIFEWFLKWYAPFLNAYSFALARAQEREADAYSVGIAGKAVAARTLVRMAEKERALEEEFWPNFFRRAHDQVQPPKDPFAQMLAGLEQPIERAKAEKWFLQTLKVETGYDDTHPSLADRLAAMGFARDQLATESVKALVQTNGSGEETAAACYLQELPDDFIPGFDRLWKERIRDAWRDRHDYIEQAQQRLGELEEKGKTQALTIDEQWERACFLGETKDRAASLPALRQILRESTDHVAANFALGAILLEQQDQAGIEYLEKAILLDPTVTGEACEMISEFYREQGREEETAAYRARAEQYYEHLERLNEQAMNFSTDDQFEPHGLTDSELQDLQSQLAGVRGLSEAYLAKKIIEASSEPLFVMGVVAGYTWREGRSEKDSGRLVNDLASNLQHPRPIVFVALEGKQEYLRAKLSQVAGALIFSRS